MQIANDLAGLVVVLAPVGLIYAWYFYFAKFGREPSGWRSRITVISLVLVSLALLLWPVAMKFAPRVDSVTYAGEPEYLSFVYACARIGICTSLIALVACFFGQRRLIAPISVACLGTVIFWLVSTIP
jgi:hypothetical protein